MSSKLTEFAPGVVVSNGKDAVIRITLSGPNRGYLYFRKNAKNDERQIAACDLPARITKLNDGCLKYADSAVRGLINMLEANIKTEASGAGVRRENVRGILFARWNAAVASADQEELKFMRKHQSDTLAREAFKAGWLTVDAKSWEIHDATQFYSAWMDLKTNNLSKAKKFLRKPRDWDALIEAMAPGACNRIRNLIRKQQNPGMALSFLYAIVHRYGHNYEELLSNRAYALYARKSLIWSWSRLTNPLSLKQQIFFLTQEEWTGILRDTWANIYSLGGFTVAQRIRKEYYIEALENVRGRARLVEIHDEALAESEANRLKIELARSGSEIYREWAANQRALAQHNQKILQELARQSLKLPNTDEVRVLTTPSDLVKEGQEQRHCVGNYASLVQYYVFLHVAGSTAMLGWDGGTGWYVIQHYGVKNKQVTLEQAYILAKYGKDHGLNIVPKGDGNLQTYLGSGEVDWAMAYCPEPPHKEGDKDLGWTF